MAANGWRKRQISTLQAEIDQFEEVMAEQILIEQEIAMIEELLNIFGTTSSMRADLTASLELAREKLQSLK